MGSILQGLGGTQGITDFITALLPLFGGDSATDPSRTQERAERFTRSTQDVQQGLLDFLTGQPQSSAFGPSGSFESIQNLLQPMQFPDQLFTPGASGLQQQAFQQAQGIQPFSVERSNQLFQQGVADPALANFRQQILPSIRSSTLPGGQTGANLDLGLSSGRRLVENLGGQQAQFQLGQQQFGADRLNQLGNIGGVQRAIQGQQGQEQFGRFLQQQPFASPGLSLFSNLTGNLSSLPGFGGPQGLGSLFGVGGGNNANSPGAQSLFQFLASL